MCEKLSKSFEMQFLKLLLVVKKSRETTRTFRIRTLNISGFNSSVHSNEISVEDLEPLASPFSLKVYSVHVYYLERKENNQETLFADFRLRALYEAKTLMTLIRYFHLALTMALNSASL